MIKFEVTLSARIFLIWVLEKYLNKFSHDKDELELINNLTERFNNTQSFEMTFSDTEIKLLITALKEY